MTPNVYVKTRLQYIKNVKKKFKFLCHLLKKIPKMCLKIA